MTRGALCSYVLGIPNLEGWTAVEHYAGGGMKVSECRGRRQSSRSFFSVPPLLARTPMTNPARLLLALLLLPIPLAVRAQLFLPGKLPDASRDSFDIVYQGQTMGAFLISVSR